MNKVLRASKAGYPCARNLWYSINNAEGITSPKTQRIFDVGTCLEPLVVEWLKQDGWEVEYNPGSQEAELEVTLPVEGGILAGHPDCFISKGDLENVLVDIKTMNDRSYTLWKREGSLKSKPQYVDQLHVYAMACIRSGRPINAHTLGIVGVNKNNSDWHIDFFELDFARAADIQDRAKALFAMTEPPTENSPCEAWCCNYCEYSQTCEIKGMYTPPKADITELPQAFIDEDDAVVHALKDLAFARQMASQAKTMEADAKQILLERSKAKSTNQLQGGGFTCTITERATTRFDTAGFKKANPELAEQYTTSTTAKYFELKEVI